MNIYPSEIEDELKKDVRTQDALIYKIEDHKSGIQIVLEISGNYQNEGEVRALCTQVLPSFQIPSIIKLVKEIPRNGSGKVVRHHENN
jgi:acyl-CoA synthetase (AMP-forming)/AMP-acid ligase II